ncbi:MAG: LytS/YhcK type 5TM receptor domain-containing protein [Syntrophales bacterium]|nr:LytS/YhcK type 5TM receptor domain-containing protein [Syntrophales bacterium]
MDLSTFGILWALIERACVVVIIFVLLFHIKYFRRMLLDKATVLDQVIMSVIFGALAIYGTYSGVQTSGAIANIRNLAPMIGGLLCGPWVGLFSGLIGAIHRYFMGGFTCLPCAIGTTLSGLVGGLLCMLWKGKMGVWKPALFAFLMEIADMGLILLIARPFDSALKLVGIIAMPMILADTFGVVVFAYLLRELKAGARQ